jgi:hypothetical protein
VSTETNVVADASADANGASVPTNTVAEIKPFPKKRKYRKVCAGGRADVIHWMRKLSFNAITELCHSYGITRITKKARDRLRNELQWFFLKTLPLVHGMADRDDLRPRYEIQDIIELVHLHLPMLRHMLVDNPEYSFSCGPGRTRASTKSHSKPGSASHGSVVPVSAISKHLSKRGKK